MARLNPTRPPAPDVVSDQDGETLRRDSEPLSRAVSFSSDKENQDRSTATSKSAGKRKTNRTPMATSSTPLSTGANKRRRTGERQPPPNQAAGRIDVEDRVDKQFYDPDQDYEERRVTRKKMRDLAKELNDSRAEYLQANSRGLVTTLQRADEYFKNVRQTSDATIDSRLLVTAADLSYKKTNELALGDASTGIDVDEFVSKCLAFMRPGQGMNGSRGAPGPSSTQTQTQRRRGRHAVAEDEDDETDQLEWDRLGREACFPYNARPCLSGFLLGPLSVQKRVRQQTQRKAREARATAANAVRPQELQAEDLEKQETANLTVICTEIAKLLDRIQKKGEASVEAAFNEEMTQEELVDLMREYGIADNSQVPLFDFCVNPKSFGQTVENMFYVSFLIKESRIGLDFDSRGMPTLGIAAPRSVEERQEAPKNQAVFTLDFDMWEEIIESHGIKKSLIPHRRDEVYDDGAHGNDGEGGWYS